MSLLITIIITWWLVGFTEPSVAYENPTCNINPYGAPHAEDCAYLLETFADSQDAKLRIFDEEELRTGRDGSWPGIINPFPEAVVQVPKFWSKSRKVMRYLEAADIHRHLPFRAYELRQS